MKLSEVIYPKGSYMQMHRDAEPIGARVLKPQSVIGVYDISGKLITSGGVAQLKRAGVYGADHEWQYGQVNAQNFVLLKFALGIDPPEQVNPKKFPRWFKPIKHGGAAHDSKIDPEISKEKERERSRKAQEKRKKAIKKELSHGEIYMFDDKTHEIVQKFKNLADALANGGVVKSALVDSIKKGTSINGKVFSMTPNWSDIELKKLAKLF